MKVYPPDQERVKTLLQDLRATKESAEGSGGTATTTLTSKVKKQEPAHQ
jgi:hypothetical protein